MNNVITQATKIVNDEFIIALRDFAVLGRDVMHSASLISASANTVRHINPPVSLVKKTVKFDLTIKVDSAPDLVGGAFALGKKLDNLVVDRVKKTNPRLKVESYPNIIEGLANREITFVKKSELPFFQ